MSELPMKPEGKVGRQKKRIPSNLLLLYLVTIPQPLGHPGTWLPINVLLLSALFWPGEPFQGDKMGLLYGLFLIIMATMQLIYGPIVDRHDRKKLLAVHNGACACIVFLYGFLPEGSGDGAFSIILILTLLLGAFKGGSCENDSPVLNSLIDDVVDEEKRSGTFGLLGMIVQVVGIPGLLVAAWVFEEHWRTYFHVVGIVLLIPVVLIMFKFNEPKRGAKKAELKSVLKRDDKVYDYKLTRETVRSTILAPTNVIALVEGFFTQAILAVPWFLIFSYVQAPPINLSPLNMGFLGVLFGVPGAYFSALVLAKLFNRFERRMRARIGLIIAFLAMNFGNYLLMASLPYPSMSPAQGADLAYIVQQPTFLILGVLFFTAQVMGISFSVNQRPVIQKVNLPEAQGLIMGANHFLEIVGNGFGVLISGFLLVVFDRNYSLTVLILVLIGIIGAVLWAFDLKWIDADVARVSGILKSRAREIEGVPPE